MVGKKKQGPKHVIHAFAYSHMDEMGDLKRVPKEAPFFEHSWHANDASLSLSLNLRSNPKSLQNKIK